MGILDELEDYVPGKDPVEKVWETNDDMYILREGEKIDIVENYYLEDLFENAEEDAKGNYLVFKYPTKCGDAVAYQSNFDSVLLVHADGRKALIGIYELHGLFAFKNMFIIYGHETIHIVDTTDFSIHEQATR